MQGTIVLEAATGKILQSSNEPDLRRMHPGSTIKPICATALLDAGSVISVRCAGSLVVGSRSLACSHPRSTAPLDLTTAIAWSCNDYFATAAKRLGASKLCDVLGRFGFDVEVPETPERLALMGVGEWGVQCTPLELAMAYRRLAGATPAPIRQGLLGAVDYGTAQLARSPRITICGKTGTSPTPGRTSSYALFAGWAPAEKPRIVVTVVSAGRGGSDAAPIARQLFEKYA